jgi:hypothetical protein
MEGASESELSLAHIIREVDVQPKVPTNADLDSYY